MPSGAASAASATLNRMFSLPVTRLNAFTNSCVTRFSARAPIRCTVAINRSTSVSVISRSRACSNAASSVNRNGSGLSRRCDGDSTAALARHPATTFGATSSNRSAGRSIARTLSSLPISANSVSRLTLPGASLIMASIGGSSSEVSPSPCSPSSINALIRCTVAGASRAEIRSTRANSPECSADRTIRSIRPAEGGSICSARHHPSNSSRTWSGRRSRVQTSAASQDVNTSASATVHSRNPKCCRICDR